MSVMEKIRSSTDSTVMRVIFGIIILVFIFWGVGSGAGMMTTQPVARVNSKRITDSDLQREMRTRMRGMGQGTLDEDQVSALSKQVLDQLIIDEVMVQEAHRIGLEVSTEEMQRYVLDIAAFKGDDGRFSVELYGRSLKRMGLSKGRFEESIRDEMMRGKLREVVLSSVTVSDAEVRELYDRTATQATIDYVRLLDADIATTVKVDPDQITDLLAKHSDQVQAAYDADKARLYSQPRKISFHRLMLKKDFAGTSTEDLQARMDKIREEAVGGGDFEALARRWSEDLSAENGGQAGTVPEPVMEPQLASAALAAGAGQISQVIDLEQGLFLLKVDGITDATQVPLEDVKGDIARQLIARQEGSRLGGERAEALLTEWKATGSAPVDLIAQDHLELDHAGPFSPTDTMIPGVGVAPALVKAVGDQAKEGVLDGVFPVEGGRVVAAVSSWSAADPTRFEQIKELIRMQLIQQEQDEVLQQWQDDLVSRSHVERFLNP